MVNTGGGYRPTRTEQIDCHVAIGFNSTAPNYFDGAGLYCRSWIFSPRRRTVLIAGRAVKPATRIRQKGRLSLPGAPMLEAGGEARRASLGEARNVADLAEVLDMSGHSSAW